MGLHEYMAANSNDRMVRFVLNMDEVDLDNLGENPSEAAADFILADIETESEPLFEPIDLYLNPNPRFKQIALDYIRRGGDIPMNCPHIFWNPCPMYPVYMWTHLKPKVEGTSPMCFKQNVLYRLPIELIRTICEYM